MPYDVFISHSQKDKDVAYAVCSAFEFERIQCWIAPRDVPPGADWAEAIMDALASCRVMILIFSSNANTSPQVKREVEQAFNNGLVVPFRIEDVQPNPGLKYYLGSVHWLDALTEPIERHIAMLMPRIKAVLGTGNSPVQRVADSEMVSRMPNAVHEKPETLETKDSEKVRECREGASQGEGNAQHKLALLLSLGLGVEQNEAEAATWERKAADQGHAEAQFGVGWNYAWGKGVTKDWVEAAKWIRKAAEQGHAEAQYHLGRCYDNGHGVAKDDAEAAKWYREAAEKGYQEAQKALGWCYRFGVGVEKDEMEAAKWEYKAQIGGH